MELHTSTVHGRGRIASSGGARRATMPADDAMDVAQEREHFRKVLDAWDAYLQYAVRSVQQCGTNALAEHE